MPLLPSRPSDHRQCMDWLLSYMPHMCTCRLCDTCQTGHVTVDTAWTGCHHICHLHHLCRLRRVNHTGRTNSMASAKPDPMPTTTYAAAVTSAAQAGSIAPVGWAVPYESVGPYEGPNAIELMSAALPDDNIDAHWLAGYSCSVTNWSRPTKLQIIVLPPLTSDALFGNYPDRLFRIRHMCFEWKASCVWLNQRCLTTAKE